MKEGDQSAVILNRYTEDVSQEQIDALSGDLMNEILKQEEKEARGYRRYEKSELARKISNGVGTLMGAVGLFLIGVGMYNFLNLESVEGGNQNFASFGYMILGSAALTAQLFRGPQR